MMRDFSKICVVLAYLGFSMSAQAELDFLKGTENHSFKNLTQAEQSNQEPVILETSWQLSDVQIKQLSSATADDEVMIENMPETIFTDQQFQNKNTTALKQIKLKSYDIFATNAHIYEIRVDGTFVTDKPPLMSFISPQDGIALLINQKTGETQGIYNNMGATLEIKGNINTQLLFYRNNKNMPEDGPVHQCLTSNADQPFDIIGSTQTALMSQTLIKDVLGTPIYEAVVAVDTDNEWMAGKSNNTSTALTYISSLFTNMNVFYERDTSMRLLVGNVFLRISPDPFPTQSDAFDSLNDFGEYWRLNNDAINREFALLLSGQNISANSFSGIAWIDQYCQNGFTQNGGTQTVGSYSINRIGTNIPTSFSAQFVAHELGHNLGSPHTHCYVPAVDNCYNAEPDCFSGTPQCPAGGKGTIMSYCHFGAPNGADCGLNNNEFHPTVISLLDSKILSNFPSCIAPIGSEIIFENGFE